MPNISGSPTQTATAVANLTELESLDTTPLTTGDMARALVGGMGFGGKPQLFVLDKTSTLTPDGDFVVAAQSGGRWVDLAMFSSGGSFLIHLQIRVQFPMVGPPIYSATNVGSKGIVLLGAALVNEIMSPPPQVLVRLRLSAPVPFAKREQVVSLQGAYTAPLIPPFFDPLQLAVYVADLPGDDEQSAAISVSAGATVPAPGSSDAVMGVNYCLKMLP